MHHDKILLENFFPNNFLRGNTHCLENKERGGETYGVKNFQQTGTKWRFVLFLLKDTWPDRLFL